MSERFTEVSSTSWFGRLKSAVGGMAIGLVLFIAGFPVLWWNEGRAKRQGDTIAEVSTKAVDASADRVDPANDRLPVHVIGQATTDETLADPTFPVAAIALRLERHVEMFQWKENSKTETRDKLGGGQERITTYTYEKAWSSSPIDSSRFNQPEQHRNPGAFPVESWSARAESATLGAYRLAPSVTSKMSRMDPVTVDEAKFGEMPFAERSRYKLHAGGLYMGADPGSPAIGDVRITWRAVLPAKVSVLALQSDGMLDTYRGTSGGTFLELSYGEATLESHVQAAQSKENLMRWGIRVGGFLMMFIGVRMLLGVIKALAMVVPFLGAIVGFGIGIVAFLVALPCALMTIAVAWIAVRPLIGIPLLIVSVGCLFLLVRGILASRRAARATAVP